MPIRSLFLYLLLITGAFAQSERTPYRLDDLAITVTAESRPVVYTNKEQGVYYTETRRAQSSSWQGWRINAHKVLDDYVIRIRGRQLLPSECTKVEVFPHQFRRYYPSGVTETVTLLDSLNALVIALDGVRGNETAIYPIFAEPRRYNDFTMAFDRNIMLIATKAHPERTASADWPAVLAVSWAGENLWTAGFYDSSLYGRKFSPCYVTTVNPDSHHVAVLVLGDSATQTVRTARFVAKNVDSLVALRKRRMERLINRSYLRTNDTRLNTALNWAKLSLDALVMNQKGKGIFAGLPWFDNYWGRDTYISLPGATLVTGAFADAREILRTFAALADTNPASPTCGRIPNLVTTGSMAYNTADGTPWFFIALDDYVRTSGDSSLLREFSQLLHRSIDVTIAHRTDSLGFLLHGDAETWMDAVGPSGPWSPRGDRANDIQALWYRQLTIGARWAARSGDSAAAGRWGALADRVKRNAVRIMLDTTGAMFADHLAPNGIPDRTLRPNELFCLAPFAAEGMREKIFRAATGELVYPHGVGTLSPADKNFHPYHTYPPYYVPDAAYHNGIVWNWLAGVWIDEAVHAGLPDLAYRLTEKLTTQILEEGAVGTLSELLDASPRDGVFRHSGTVSQAWSLAEYIRTIYRSYLGIRPDALDRTLALSPRLPSGIDSVDARVAVGTGEVELEYRKTGDGLKLRLRSQAAPLAVKLDWRAGGLSAADLDLPAGASLDVTASGSSLTGVPDAAVRRIAVAPPPDVRFAVPPVSPEVRGPAHRLLANSEVKAANPDAPTLLDAADPAGDEAYTYPLTSNLEPGSLDITHCTVTADKQNVYFRLQFAGLSDPGWHPEYGFQLTYVAIAIDRDGKPGSGQTRVGMNARYQLDSRRAFERIIYVGGGLQVADAQGEILAEYIPVPGDERVPLGDIGSRTIAFALPVDLLGRPDASWKFSLLVGCQDDHGGAGIGDFRNVGETAGEWTGGGKKRTSDSNVYDVMLPKR